MNPKADAGQNQEVIEGSRVTLDGTESKSGKDGGWSYLWKQVNGPKVRIIDSNAAIASFEAPKVSPEKDKIILKFVLLITDDSDNADGKSDINNSIDKDSVIVTVVQEQVQELSSDHRINHVPPTSNNNNKDNDGPPSQHKSKVSSDEPKKIDESDVSNFNEKAKSEGVQNEESVPSPDNMEPIESTEANPASGDSIS